MDIQSLSNPLSDRLTSISKEIDETTDRMEQDAKAKERRAKREHEWDIFFRATIAVLAVVSPALVTYSTTPNVGAAYKLAAILLSGIAGASVTLQSIFALQQNYVRNAIDALDLYEAKAQLQSDRDAASKMGDVDKLQNFSVALSKASMNYKQIIMGRQRAFLERQQQ